MLFTLHWNVANHIGIRYVQIYVSLDLLNYICNHNAFQHGHYLTYSLQHCSRVYLWIPVKMGTYVLILKTICPDLLKLCRYHCLQLLKTLDINAGVSVFFFSFKGSGTLLVRLYKDAGTPVIECSPTKFWKALKSLSLGRFTRFKKPALLIQALPFSWNRHWKDLGSLNTLKYAQTLPLKSTIFPQLTENIFELHQISMPKEIFSSARKNVVVSCKNYFQWGVGIICNMELYFLPIGVYGKSGMPKWLWKSTKSSDSKRDHSLSESKVLGFSMTCYKCF